VGGMAGRAGESVIDMARVLAEAGIGNDLTEIVALGAQ
jgi:hypothetical protein